MTPTTAGTIKEMTKIIREHNKMIEANPLIDEHRWLEMSLEERIDLIRWYLVNKEAK